MGMETVRDRSSGLESTMHSRLTDAGHGNVIEELLAQSRELLDGVRERTVKSVAPHHLGGIVQDTRL